MVSSQPSTAATLLRHYHWNPEKLSDKFWEEPAKTLHAAGLSPPSSPSSSTKPLPASSNAKASSSRSRLEPVPTQSFECPICCLEFEPEEIASQTLSLGCEHRFCKGCWTEYLERKILDEQESGRVQCMEDGCGRVVGERTVIALVNDKAKDR